MIGRLCGIIEQWEADGSVVVDVQGVGYEVYLPAGTAGRLGTEPGKPAVLHVHTHVREEAMTLYGFAAIEDRAAFRALLKVASIGPKVALAILGSMSAHDLQRAVAMQDRDAFKGITGVGRKTAERLLVDLQGKLDLGSDPTAVGSRAVLAKGDAPSDTVVSALVQMGYRRGEAEAAVVSAEHVGEQRDVEGLLRAALSALS